MTRRHGEPDRAERAVATWRPDDEGRPLPRRTRAYYERLLATDLEDVRIHDGPDAVAMAGSLDALAYVIGDDVVVRPKALAGGEGEHVLAHELVHVAQARRGGVGDRAGAEHAADAGARAMAGGGRPSVGGAGAAIQRYRATSLTEVPFEDTITGILDRRVTADDTRAQRRRVDDLERYFARLSAYDSMVLHGRLLAESDALGQLFHLRLSTPTRERLLQQLLRQSQRGGEAPATTPDAEQQFLDGVGLVLPDVIYVDPLQHPNDTVQAAITTAVPMPADLELQAEWVVECIAPDGDAHEVASFSNAWPPGMSLFYTYDIAFTDEGTHVFTLRLRDRSGDVVKIVRGRYAVTSDIPQSLTELQASPQYIDSFARADYDPDYRPDHPGSLSYWAGLEFPDGMAYVDTRQVADTGHDATEFHWQDGRIWPGELNPVTAPNLVAVKGGIAEWMDEYNSLFVLQAFASGVLPILMDVPMRVGAMPDAPASGIAPRIRARAPVAPPPVPDPAAGGGGGVSAGAMRTIVDADTTIVDNNITSALDRASSGQPLQPGFEELAEATLGGARVAAPPRAVAELGARPGTVGATVPTTITTGTAAERDAIVAELTAARVGPPAGAADREIIAEAVLARTEPGVTPVYATGDTRVINGLARMGGIRPDRLGRYPNVASYLYYARGGSRTFAVLIGGRPLIVRPIQPLVP